MIVVTGGNGQVGSAVGALVGDRGRVLTRSDLDVTNHEAFASILDATRPNAVINCAAYTAVDAAEDDVAAAFAINADAVGTMAAVCADRGIRFVTISTDYVFDGNAVEPYVESSETDPINVYGESKLTGEIAALEAHPESAIVRTSWVMSATHRNFLTAILDRSAKGPIRVVDDQVGCPTFASDLAVGLVALCRTEVSGIVHMVNQGPTTWYQVAKRAVALAGGDPSGVSACPTEEYPTRAVRPRYSVLGTERLPAGTIDLLPSVEDGLRRTVAAIR